MNETYPAVTVFQPWTTLIAFGFKPLEFRRRPSPASYVGKRVAIHAAARPVRRSEVRLLLNKLRSSDFNVRLSTGLVRVAEVVRLLEAVYASPGILPLASVLCLATIGESLRNEALAERMGVEWVNDSDRQRHSNWGWPLSEIELLEPFVPAIGHQGWWKWTRP